MLSTLCAPTPDAHKDADSAARIAVRRTGQPASLPTFLAFLPCEGAVEEAQAIEGVVKFR